jgi:hypothetical protein
VTPEEHVWFAVLALGTPKHGSSLLATHRYGFMNKGPPSDIKSRTLSSWTASSCPVQGHLAHK